jgi:hypothetical protein
LGSKEVGSLFRSLAFKRLPTTFSSTRASSDDVNIVSVQGIFAMVRPLLFIGSSTEGKDAASAFHKILNGESVDAIYWKDHDAFAAGVHTLTALIDAAKDADFALFIIRADDVTRSRSKQAPVVRDNVLFEYGLFLGVLGDKRVFAVYEEDGSKKRVKIPSDLLGVGIPPFRGASSTELAASARAALNHGILSQIQSIGRRERRIDLPADWELDKKKSAFKVTVNPVRLLEHRRYLNRKKLAVVARRSDPTVGITDDPQVVVGALCKVTRDPVKIVLSVADQRFTRKPVRKTDAVEGYILAVPAQMDHEAIVALETIEQMIKSGCDRCGGGGVSI